MTGTTVIVFRPDKVAALISRDHVPVAPEKRAGDIGILFPSTPSVRQDISLYDSGELFINSKRFVKVRKVVMRLMSGPFPFDVTPLQELARAA